MMGLATRLLRHRAGSAVATLVALGAGIMILMSMGALVESGLRFRPEPQRYAAADIVVADREITFTGKDFTGENVTTTVRLPEGGAVPAELAGRIRLVPGVADTMVYPGAAAGRTDAIGVVAAAGADRKALVTAVEKLADAAGAETFAGADRGWAERSDLTAARDLLIQAGGAFGGYVTLLIVFVVAGTTGLSVRHRRRDLALLRAVAATAGQVRRMIVAETVLLAAVAAGLGVPAGVLATRWVHDELIARGFLPAAFPMAVSPLPALAAVAVTMLSAVLAALIAARRVTRIRPVEALGEIAVEPPRSSTVRFVMGLLTAAGAVSAGAVTAGAGGEAALAGAIGMLYLFVTAVGLLAPWINRTGARLLAPLLRRVWGAGGHLAAANLRTNAAGMAPVLTALVLSVGFGGSVWFLQTNLERHTVTQTRAGMLADRVLAAPGGLPATAAHEMRRIPGVRAVTPVRRTALVVKTFDGAETVGAQAVDPRDAAATMDLDVSAGSVADLRGDTVAVSALRAGTHGWRVGDRVRIWLGDGTPAELRVAAVYERGLSFGDFVLATQTIAGHTARDLDDEMLIRTEAGADIDTALAAVAARLPGSTVLPTGELTARLAHDLAVGAWLNRLFVGVMAGYAALAAANTMIMAALARRRELAVLRLVGVTRRQIRRMVNAEQTGLLGVALVIGAGIAAATLTAVVRPVTGADIPYVPPLGWGTVLGGATLLALTTTVLPVERLLRVPPVEQIGVKE